MQDSAQPCPCCHPAPTLCRRWKHSSKDPTLQTCRSQALLPGLATRGQCWAPSSTAHQALYLCLSWALSLLGLPPCHLRLLVFSLNFEPISNFRNVANIVQRTCFPELFAGELLMSFTGSGRTQFLPAPAFDGRISSDSSGLSHRSGNLRLALTSVTLSLQMITSHLIGRLCLDLGQSDVSS